MANVSRETDFTIPVPEQTRRVVVANQKGGVGKTTTAVNVASALAREGHKVLLIDMDPQGNASTALGIEHSPDTKGTYEVLIGHESIADLAQTSPESENLKVLPATVDLSASEIELVSLIAREQRIAQALKDYEESNDVDWVFFDCPPSLSLLTVNAMVAANELLIPIQTEYYALEGLTQLMHTISMIRQNLNSNLRVSGILLTMYDARTKLSSQVAAEIAKHFPDQIIKTVISRSVRISEAPSYGQTILEYDPKSVGAKAYRKVAYELSTR